ncbi:E3 ubiquitin-protein ligase MIB2-like [Haemaphysalis longicornis]
MGSSNSKITPTCTLASKGQRVTPGPTWAWWSYRAIAPGYVGTVIGANPSHGTQEAAVVVLWDSGVLGTYPSNQTGFSPLRLFDSGPTGVHHRVGPCRECSGPLVGTRWKCRICWEHNLCNPCYMNDKHFLDHAFFRFDLRAGSGVEVPPRMQAAKMQVMGIFLGAKVVRGQHWRYINELNAACVGTVLTLGDSEDGSKRNQAQVRWTRRITRTCSVGHGGCVDIKCTVAASGGYFYPDHMPLIAPVEHSPGHSASCDTTFHSGEQVAIMLDVDAFRRLQEEYEEINPELERDIYRLGAVQDVIRGGDVSVTFGGDLRWPVSPRVLTKVAVLSPGDQTKVIDDFDTLKNFQIGHGGCTEAMRKCLGQIGVVLKVFPTQDVRVLVSGEAWTFNRFCLRLVTATPSSDISDLLGKAAKESGLCDVVAGILPRVVVSSAEDTPANSFGVSSTGRLFSEVPAASCKGGDEQLPDDSMYSKAGSSESKTADGKLCGPDENPMEGLVRVTRDWVNIESNEGSPREEKRVNGMPVHLACHSGRVETVRLMATCGADLEKEDGDGDTPLHYAVHGNEPMVAQLLLSLGVTINATNKWGRTALHIATSKAFVNCVRVLVKYAGVLDVNIQDDGGCTALHEAIESNMDILALLLDDPHVDLRIKNNAGCNVLHLAALKGNIPAAEAIVSEAPELAGVKDEYGYTPLHSAAMKGHYQVANILLQQGDCVIDDVSNRQCTPLWLAVSEGHVDVVELLVENGADVNKPDKDGNSPMHMSIMNRSKVQFHAINATTAPCIAAVVDRLLEVPEPGIDTSLALACYLAKRGGDLHQMNAAGITLLEMANNLGEDVEESLLIWKTSACGGADLELGSPIRGACGGAPSGNGPTNSSGAPAEIGLAKRLRASLREMTLKYQEMEDVYVCGVCCERPRDVAFSCGHRACAQCARHFQTCPWCRKPITSRIALY